MPRLTEQEQQEILRFLEADKPLPDKYRFLLFEDKRPAACGNRTAGRIQSLALGAPLTIDTLPTLPVIFSDAHSATKRAVPILLLQP